VTDADALARVIGRRRMVRRFDARAVPPELVDELTGYALRAPSAGFTQAVSLLVLTEQRVRRFWAVSALPRGVNPDQLLSEPPNAWLAGMMTAPVIVLVWTDRGAYERRYAEPDKGWGTDPETQPWAAPYWWVDAGMAVENVLLGATAQGLGACFFGVPPDRADAVRGEFGVPAEQLSVGAIALGWAAEATESSGSPRRRKRRHPAELIHKEAW
jgi:nitroreductase